MTPALAEPRTAPNAAHRSLNRRARVLHIVLNLEAGGLERLVVDIANRADPTRFDSHVLALQFAGRQATDLHTDVHVAPSQSRWSMLRPRALASAIAALAPDIVHTHSGVWYKASLASRLAGVRCMVHTDHGRLIPDPLSGRMIDGVAARRTDVVVAVSSVLADYMGRALRVPAAKLRVIRNGVDLRAAGAPNALATRDRRALVRLELGIGLDVPVIGSIGRLDWIKGYDLMLDAFARLRADWIFGAPPALVIAGDGPERLRLRAAVAALPCDVRADVHLLGWRTDVNDLLASFDVFAMSSRSEGTSVSLLEAMSARICPVVTDVGGNADVLGPALAARLVPPNDPSAFAHALLAAVREPWVRRRDGERARSVVESNYSIDGMVRKYERLYSELLAR